jgi:DNA-binding MarR family transcriptional regulator
MKPPPTPLREEIRQTRPFRSAAEEAAVGLLLTTEQLRRHLGATVAPEQITLQQYNVLRILRGVHPEPMQTLEIAARMLEHTPGITRLLDRLESKELVSRQRGLTDRRCVHCRITQRGLALLEKLDEPMLEAAESGFRDLTPAQIAELSSLLDRVREQLRAAAPATGTVAGSPVPNPPGGPS